MWFWGSHVWMCAFAVRMPRQKPIYIYAMSIGHTNGVIYTSDSQRKSAFSFYMKHEDDSKCATLPLDTKHIASCLLFTFQKHSLSLSLPWRRNSVFSVVVLFSTTLNMFPVHFLSNCVQKSIALYTICFVFCILCSKCICVCGRTIWICAEQPIESDKRVLFVKSNNHSHECVGMNVSYVQNCYQS